MMFERGYRWVRRISVLFSVALYGLSLFFYSRLPAKIPIQFGLDGRVTNWGSRGTVFLFPTLLLLIAIISSSNYSDMKYPVGSMENRVSKIALCGSLLLICGVGIYLFFLYARMLE